MMDRVILIDIGAGPLPDTTPVQEHRASWLPSAYQAPLIPAPPVVPTPIANGTVLEWPAANLPGAFYIIERGQTADGPWIEVARTSETRYTYFSSDPGTWWFRVRVAVWGVDGEGQVVQVTPVLPPTIAQLVELQAAQDAERLERLAGDLDAVSQAAADASAKADAAREAAIAQVDVVAAQVADILEADTWVIDQTYPVGDLVQHDGKLYRARIESTGEQPDLSPAAWDFIGNYASLGEAVAGAVSLGHANASEIAAEAAQLDAVQARMPTGTGSLATQASVLAEGVARADADTALATRTAAVEARMPAGTDELATSATVAEVERASADRNSALANRTAVIEARMPAGASALATEASVTEEADARAEADRANASALTAVKAQLGATGGNLVTNSTGEADLDSWKLGGEGLSHAQVTFSRNYPSPWTLPPGTMYMKQMGTAASGYSDARYNDSRTTVEPGKRYCAQLRAMGHRTTGTLYLGFFDRAGAMVGNWFTALIAQTPPPMSTGDTLEKFQHIYTFGDAPAGAATARIMVRKWASDGMGSIDSFLFFTRVALNEVPAGATTPPAWQPSLSGLDGKYAAATQSLEARVTETEAGLVSQATAMTNVKAQLGGGGNMLPNSEFATGTAGWNIGNNTGMPANATSNNGSVGNGNVHTPQNARALLLQIPGTPPTGKFVEAYSAVMPVVAGSKHILSCWVNVFRCNAELHLLYYNAAGEVLAAPSVSQSQTALTNATLAQMPRMSIVAAAPPGTVAVRVHLRLSTNGGGNPHAWFFRPMLEEVPADKNQPSPWSSGGGWMDEKYAAVTQSLESRATINEAGVAAYKASHTVTLDVNGNISGTRSENDGTKSSFSVLATIFRVLGFGATGMEWQNGYLRIWKGASQFIIGNSFGAAGDLILWYGPNIGAAACTKANGTVWFDTASGAYFGGTLSAGVYKNAVQTTSTLGNAEVVNGPFATRGRPKVIVVSYEFYKRDQANTGTYRPATGSTTATINLYRRIGNGINVLVSSFNVVGGAEVLNEPGGPSTLTCYMGGSHTYTDHVPGTEQFTYWAAIVARTNHSAVPSGGNVMVSVTQTLGIISTEQ